MAILTRYETFEELKADRPAISGIALAQKLENKDKEAQEFYELLKKSISNLTLEDEIR